VAYLRNPERMQVTDKQKKLGIRATLYLEVIIHGRPLSRLFIFLLLEDQSPLYHFFCLGFLLLFASVTK
jgi:hypothetical protein